MDAEEKKVLKAARKIKKCCKKFKQCDKCMFYDVSHENGYNCLICNGNTADCWKLPSK